MSPCASWRKPLITKVERASNLSGVRRLQYRSQSHLEPIGSAMKLPALLFALAAIVLTIVATCFALAAMKLPVRLFGIAAVVLTVIGTWYALKHTHRPRDPVAYYTSWGG